MKIRKDDKVKIISGKDRGKISKVLKVLKNENKVVVEGVNVVKKHVKPGVISKEGGIVSIEKPIDVSNVMYYHEQSKEAIKIRTKKGIKGRKSLGMAAGHTSINKSSTIINVVILIFLFKKSKTFLELLIIKKKAEVKPNIYKMEER